MLQQETAGAGMPKNSGMARSMYCCRTATRSVLAADTFSSAPVRSSYQESGNWGSHWRTGAPDTTGWSTRADSSAR